MKTAGASRRVSGVIDRALMLCMLALPLTAVGQAQTDAERFVGDYTLISYVTFPGGWTGGRHEICGQAEL